MVVSLFGNRTVVNIVNNRNSGEKAGIKPYNGVISTVGFCRTLHKPGVRFLGVL